MQLADLDYSRVRGSLSCHSLCGCRAELIGLDASIRLAGGVCWFASAARSSHRLQQRFHGGAGRAAGLVMGVGVTQAVRLGVRFREWLMVFGEVAVRVRSPQFVVPLFAVRGGKRKKTPCFRVFSSHSRLLYEDIYTSTSTYLVYRLVVLNELCYREILFSYEMHF